MNEDSSKLPSFDEMVLLAKENPEKLEAIRKKAVEEVINQAPIENQKKLRGLQNQIDLIKRTSGNKLITTQKLYSKMWDSFDNLNEKLQSFRDLDKD